MDEATKMSDTNHPRNTFCSKESFTVFRLLTDFVCLYNYEFWLSLCKIVRSSVILLLPLLIKIMMQIVITASETLTQRAFQF